jgi:hypothetical protein
VCVTIEDDLLGASVVEVVVVGAAVVVVVVATNHSNTASKMKRFASVCSSTVLTALVNV